MATAYEQALAELRALTPRPTAEPPAADNKPACCTGDRRGYQWHQRTGNLPACEESLAAAREYMQSYKREWRRRKRVTA